MTMPKVIGALVQYDSTVRAHTTITVECGMNPLTGVFSHFVRTRTSDVKTYEVAHLTETAARAHFEQHVMAHVEQGL